MSHKHHVPDIRADKVPPPDEMQAWTAELREGGFDEGFIQAFLNKHFKKELIEKNIRAVYN